MCHDVQADDLCELISMFLRLCSVDRMREGALHKHLAVPESLSRAHPTVRAIEIWLYVKSAKTTRIGIVIRVDKELVSTKMYAAVRASTALSGGFTHADERYNANRYRVKAGAYFVNNCIERFNCGSTHIISTFQNHGEIPIQKDVVMYDGRTRNECILPHTDPSTVPQISLVYHTLG